MNKKIYISSNTQSHSLLCHEMARHIHDKCDSAEFGFLMSLKEGKHYDYLKKQEDIKYHYLDVVDELEKKAISYEIPKGRVSEWEQRIHSPLMDLVVADRNIGHMFVSGAAMPSTDMMKLMDQETMSRIVCFFLDFFDRRIDEFKPDCVFFVAGIASMSNLALARVCEDKGVPYYPLWCTRFRGRYTLELNDYDSTFRGAQATFKRNIDEGRKAELSEELVSYVESFNSRNPESPFYVRDTANEQDEVCAQHVFSFWYDIIFGLTNAIRRLVVSSIRGKSHLRYKQPIANWRFKTRQKLAIRYFDRRIFDENRMEEESYIYYPLHMDPEAATMVLAPNLTNQLALLELLAKNTPMTHKIYVKEYSIMIGRRPKGFYEKIKSYPNICLLSPAEDNFRLMRYSDTVVVITGTAGWEALLMGKPAVTFGECFYSGLKRVRRCASFDDLGDILQESIEENGSPVTEDVMEDLKLFLSALYEHSFLLPLGVVWGGRTIPPECLTDSEKKAAHIVAEQLWARI